MDRLIFYSNAIVNPFDQTVDQTYDNILLLHNFPMVFFFFCLFLRQKRWKTEGRKRVGTTKGMGHWPLNLGLNWVHSDQFHRTKCFTIYLENSSFKYLDGSDCDVDFRLIFRLNIPKDSGIKQFVTHLLLPHLDTPFFFFFVRSEGAAKAKRPSLW